MSKKDIHSEIDETLDRLIENAAALEKLSPLTFGLERDLLNQLQESLLAHLFYLQKQTDLNKPLSTPVSAFQEFSQTVLSSLSKPSSSKRRMKLSRSRLKISSPS